MVAELLDDEKKLHYAAGISTSTGTTSFYPIAFESTGTFSPEAKKFIKDISKHHALPIDSQLWSPSSTTFKSYWVQRLATTLRRTTAELIIAQYYTDNYEPHLAV